MITFTLKNDKYTLELPSLTYGTASFERHDMDETYFKLLDAYVEAGGTCLDTARTYCSWLEDGLDTSEGVIGRWMKARGNRKDMIIVTKGGHPNHGDMYTSRLSREEIEYDINRSLEVLGTDYVDIFLLHRDDESIDVAEIMPVLNDIVKSGKAHFIGVSNWKTSRIEKANKFALENGMEPIRISQINYSLAHLSKDMLGDDTLVSMDSTEHAWYAKNNFPVMAFSPQAKGFFSKLAKGESVKNIIEGQFVSTANLARLAKVIKLCKEIEKAPAVVVLGYLNSQPFFVSSVFSASKVWQIEEDMGAQDMVFDKNIMASLEL